LELNWKVRFSPIAAEIEVLVLPGEIMAIVPSGKVMLPRPPDVKGGGPVVLVPPRWVTA
jgi:hypothetical protein